MCLSSPIERLAARAIGMGGTSSGEHGVGYGKLKYLQMEHGDTAVRVMHTIKTVRATVHMLGEALPPCTPCSSQQICM